MQKNKCVTIMKIHILVKSRIQFLVGNILRSRYSLLRYNDLIRCNANHIMRQKILYCLRIVQELQDLIFAWTAISYLKLAIDAYTSTPGSFRE